MTEKKEEEKIDKKELKKINLVQRDKRGRVTKGSILNPNGRPKGKMMSSIIRNFLQECPEGMTETYAMLITKSLANQAMKGNVKAIAEVIDRVDGKAVQTIREELDEVSDEVKEKIDSLFNKFLE